MKSRRIYWTKMTFYSAEFFFKYQMEEPSVKFSYTSWCGCYIHSLLAASKHHLKNYDRISVVKPISPKIFNRWNKRMHSSRMRTARSLTVSHCKKKNWKKSRTPRKNYTCRPEKITHPPTKNYTCPPQKTTHAPSPPYEQNHTHL